MLCPVVEPVYRVWGLPQEFESLCGLIYAEEMLVSSYGVLIVLLMSHPERGRITSAPASDNLGCVDSLFVRLVGINEMMK